MIVAPKAEVFTAIFLQPPKEVPCCFVHYQMFLSKTSFILRFLRRKKWCPHLSSLVLPRHPPSPNTEVFNVLFYDPIQNGNLCSFSFLLSHASPSRGSYRENFIYFFYFSACRGHFLPSRDFYRTNFQSNSFANGDSYRKKQPLRLSPAA